MIKRDKRIKDSVTKDVNRNKERKMKLKRKEDRKNSIFKYNH